MAHYYVNADIKAIADYVGDSYFLAKIASEIPQKNIMMCGVSFMGESIKILNPEKTVIMPDLLANCPMAHMASVEKIREIRKKYPDVAVVCYINSTADLKTQADVCVTSSNAVKIVNSLPQKNIYFIPDDNLGKYVAKMVPEKKFIFNEGYCYVHAEISGVEVEKAKETHPSAIVLAHPECRPEVLELADYIGSTSGIIEEASRNNAQEFIICTEIGVFDELKANNPDKKFYTACDSSTKQICYNMKKNTLEKVVAELENFNNVIEIDETKRQKAVNSLDKMIHLAK